MPPPPTIVIGWSNRLCAAGYRFLAQPDWFLPQPDRLAAPAGRRAGAECNISHISTAAPVRLC